MAGVFLERALLGVTLGHARTYRLHPAVTLFFCLRLKQPCPVVIVQLESPWVLIRLCRADLDIAQTDLAFQQRRVWCAS